jgi:hypothetical protein
MAGFSFQRQKDNLASKSPMIGSEWNGMEWNGAININLSLIL